MIKLAHRGHLNKLKLFTRRLMSSSVPGDYASAFKGSGLEFDQIREYQFGDDIRTIDWNSSAKMDRIMVKQYVQERDRTVIVAVDTSSSSFFSSKEDLKWDLVGQVGLSVAFVAANSGDRVGAMFFSDEVENWFPPSKGNAHWGRISTAFDEVVHRKNKKTNFEEALKFLAQLKNKNAILFIISDFIDENSKYQKLLKMIAKEYDFVAVRVNDARERSVPSFGWIRVEDIETGEASYFDTRKSSFNDFLGRCLDEQKKLFEKNRIDVLDLEVGRPFLNPLIKFFQKRIKRQI